MCNGDGDPDDAGDVNQTRTHNKANEIEDTVNQTPDDISGTPDWVDPAYDLAGNMTAGPQPRYETADANTQLYVYDAWNRLTKIYRDADTDDLIDDPDELVATYSYDGQNRRIRKVLENGESDITYDYYYNESWQVLEVRKGGNANPLEQYVWGAQYIDAPVVRFYDGDLDGLDPEDEDDSTLYYTYDGNFNVTAVIKPDGTVAERYTYDPYGQVTFKAADWSDAASQAKSAYNNEILYCGYRWDPESGNYIARRRYLTPPLGRWLSRDRIGYGDGMNMFSYCRSAPTDWVDPIGTVPYCTSCGWAGVGPCPCAREAQRQHALDTGGLWNADIGTTPLSAEDMLRMWLKGHNEAEYTFGPESQMTKDLMGSSAIVQARNSILTEVASKCPDYLRDTKKGYYSWENDAAEPSFFKNPLDFLLDLFSTRHIIASYAWTAEYAVVFNGKTCKRDVTISFEIRNDTTTCSALRIIPYGANKCIGGVTGDVANMRNSMGDMFGGNTWDYTQYWKPYDPKFSSETWFGWLPQNTMKQTFTWSEHHSVECEKPKDK
jgi:RHS repeat-associated protein